MDINSLVEFLRATLQPDQRVQAEQKLSEVCVMITKSRKKGTRSSQTIDEHLKYSLKHRLRSF